MKKYIDVLDYSSEILKALKKGVLLTTKNNDKVNSMTISWGKLGIEWNKEIFITYVRSGRFTHKVLEDNPEFTINIPVQDFDKKILGICGTKSGYDIDKVQELGLNLVDGEEVSVPAIKELPLTLECKVIYVQQQDANAISKEMKDLFYPEEVASDFHSANKDFHTMFYGEIVKAYILED
jgi:flavin reductase (DIM6/NTAB) family NADH-FMN oxidoreductase RutF